MSILKDEMITTLALGGIITLARYGYLSIKSYNETYADKVKTNMEAEEQIVRLMDSDEYKEYVSKRIELYKEVILSFGDFRDSPAEYIEEYLDAIVGKDPLSE